MIKRVLTEDELRELRMIAKHQFGVGEEFIPDNAIGEFSQNTLKLRRVFVDSQPYLAVRATDFKFNLYIASGRVLNRLLPHPRLRVYVPTKYSDFIAKGGNVFCKHVLMADPDIRPEDEVLVVDEKGDLIAVGRAVKPGWEMVFYKWGEAVRIRQGVLG
ncbi:PUA domain-containing protein [Thermogladius sp. 4427co]|uniref:PUA domain-containing protein n=1 Tax=Thermogladius sp. 4427co TaxID=3450718 RepID=UPI003F794B1E